MYTSLCFQFLGILVAILLLQIVAAVLGFVFSDMVNDDMVEQLKCYLSYISNNKNFAEDDGMFKVLLVLPFIFQVLERTEKLMRKAIIRYREDLDLENVIDFVQKKVNIPLQFMNSKWSGKELKLIIYHQQYLELVLRRTGAKLDTLNVQSIVIFFY